MKQNVKPVERFLRLLLGAVLLSLVFLGPQTAWGYIGLIAIVTALSGFCPLYQLFGVQPCCPDSGKKQK